MLQAGFTLNSLFDDTVLSTFGFHPLFDSQHNLALKDLTLVTISQNIIVAAARDLTMLPTTRISQFFYTLLRMRVDDNISW